MTERGATWALVLAAGSGSRLEMLTTTASGQTIPKQFCSLQGGPALIHEALQRAAAVCKPAQICTVVAEQHRIWWRPSLAQLPESNVIVQPQNRGTANGVLWPLLHILERDPDAVVVLLPSDHHVDNEELLAAALRQAIDQARLCSDAVVLLGMEPEEADAELGYILPQQPGSREGSAVAHFAEKPAALYAQQLIEAGALWNTFIVAARAQSLLMLFKSRCPELVLQMQAFKWELASSPPGELSLHDLYDRLPELDFSHHILVGRESRLRVLAVPRCGWNDLGTPRRVTETLRRQPRLAQMRDLIVEAAHLNLAAQCERLSVVPGIVPVS
ncbi:MAG: sugar phosphate nucleotidyltransferase [Steroidobacteraceae bacterium]